MERLPALWFPDGNLVICAGSVLFRVYRGILAARSPVFADILASPPFSSTEDAETETLDGCPVLHLDDSAADTMYFLKAIFDYEFFAPYPAPTDFDAIHGVLRLGTKYRVAPLRRRALRHLSSAHPTRLGAWDALCGVGHSASSTSTQGGGAASASGSASTSVSASAAVGSGSSAPSSWVGPYFGPSFDPAHLELPILTLARAARAPWVLPAAFLRAAAALAGGVLGSLDVLEGIDYTGVHVELERGDKVLLLEAGGALLGEGTSELLGFLWSPTVCPGCVYAQSGAAASTSTAPPGPNATAAAAGPGTNAATAGVMNPCTANRLAMRVAAERWRADALLPIAVASGWRGGERGEFYEYDHGGDFPEREASGSGAGTSTGAGTSVSAGAGPSTSGGGGRAQEQDEEGMDEDEAQDGGGEEEGRAIWGEEDFSRLSVCAPCLAYMKADWATRRARFWDRLPGVFGLPPWAELERERRRQEGGRGA
ncbi:hypothetical protein C8R45DRAFT_863808 [Mycena sanguinolenta]|nr:hypothetical protein C8R45DRAFT_863808 [Mycena sanguinolenta]